MSAISYPPELPVSQKRQEIARAIQGNPVVIVAGETGSGKTTQLPKICLELGRARIAHTQPRRLAARTIAERVAWELGSEVGGLVGYQVRFTDHVGPDTRIALMTDGILLNAIHRDRTLSQYDTIIIDEAHERSLNIDFLLGYLKRVLAQRDDLKVIVTSATIDPEGFAAHFASADGTPAPIIEVSGRTFPVQVRYRPLVAEADDEDAAASVDRDYLTGITDALDELARESAGDVLVFLSGETEIRDAEDAVRGHLARRGAAETTEVLPLYGRLSAADQHRVFGRPAAGIRRRIVLATNVAETSLTVPGIRYVVDAGTARISRYSTRSKVQQLPIEAISQASATQRSGRSGRTSDGIAIRLYSEQDFLSRPQFTEPEILRTNLAAVILQMISLGLGEIDQFPFLTPPISRGVKDGLDLLAELGALRRGRPGEAPRLTRVGRDLARMPIDPRFARMVLESRRHGAVRDVLAIVAGLSIQDPRERPLAKRAQADQAHARFTDRRSDFLTLLNLWNYLDQKQHELSSSAFRRLCKAEYLNYLRVREWRDVERQLRRLAKQIGITAEKGSGGDADAIHRSLLAGLLSHLGVRDAQKKEYVGARGTRFVVFPGSTLAKKPPETIMSAELVETSRLFARTNAAVDLAWAEPIAGELAKHSYAEPHWEKSQGQAVVYEKVTLYGVPIVPRRRIQFSRIDQQAARDLFIRHGLIEHEWPVQARGAVFAFVRANDRLLAELEQLEERTRTRGILLDDEAVFAFFDERLPADIASTRDFERWWRNERASRPDLLTMARGDLIDEEDEPADADARAFPTTWQQGETTLALRYRFEPGAEDDGVSVEVPLALLPSLSPAGFDWQVPGLRAELVTALLRALPKVIRRHVVPAADWAARLLAELPEGPSGPDAQPFPQLLGATIRRLTGTPVDVEDFDLAKVPNHLRMTFRAIDGRGRGLGSSKSLAQLQRRFGAQAASSVAAATARAWPIERRGIAQWDFEEIPEQVTARQPGTGAAGGGVIRGYPALVESGSGVDLSVLPTAQERDHMHEAGVLRLLMNAVPSPTPYVRKHLTQPEKLILAASPYPSVAALFDDCLRALALQTLHEHEPDGPVRTRAQFERVREALSEHVVDGLFETVSLTAKVLTAWRAGQRRLGGRVEIALLPALTDARAQSEGLVFDGFVSATGLVQLRQLPRYLSALEWRLERLADNPGRDATWMAQVRQCTERFAAAGGTIPPAAGSPPRLVHARWMLEELRVGLFAQHLGTAETVSAQRIAKVLAGP